jgi:hypothetical protein
VNYLVYLGHRDCLVIVVLDYPYCSNGLLPLVSQDLYLSDSLDIGWVLYTNDRLLNGIESVRELLA